MHESKGVSNVAGTDKSLYQKLGASASKAGLHSALKASGIEDSGHARQANELYFASLLPDAAGDSKFRSFVHADGAGTKCIVAYLLYRATNDAKYFASLAQDALVMNLDDVYCVGTPDSLQLSNLVARNSALIGDEALTAILTRYRQLEEELNALGIPLKLAGGETADCGDVVRTLLVDAVLAGRICYEKTISTTKIADGDVIVGLSSTGQSIYESSLNSGIGSNGLTLARHSLLNNSYKSDFPEVVDPTLSASPDSYRGPFLVTDTEPTLCTASVGEALLSPTRTYAPLLKKIYEELGRNIHGVIHLTGGGQTKVLRFAPGKKVVKDSLFEVPAIFQLIQQHGAVSWQEMYQVFNMGHRMELYVPESLANTVTDIARSFRIDAQTIGYVEAAKDEQTSEVSLQTTNGNFLYTHRTV